VQCRAEPSETRPHWQGRIEPAVSGQAVHFDALEELLAFVIRVLTEVEGPQAEENT
jgi:hypothetical protein